MRNGDRVDGLRVDKPGTDYPIAGRVHCNGNTYFDSWSEDGMCYICSPEHPSDLIENPFEDVVALEKPIACSSLKIIGTLKIKLDVILHDASARYRGLTLLQGGLANEDLAN